jgi:hypothetical protein
VGAVYYEAGFESLLAGFLRIECWHRRVERRSDPFTSATRHHLRARRRRLHADGTSCLERPQELTQDIFAVSFGDDQQRVGGQHGVAAYAHSVATCVGVAEMVKQPGTRFDVGGRAAVGRVLVAHDEQTHGAAHA